MKNCFYIYLLNLLFMNSLCNAAEGIDSKPSKTQLCYMSAVELIQLFKAHVVSPIEVLNAQIERIESLNPHVIAISERHYEEALIQAKESTARYLQGNPRPLEGLTCAIKDDLEVEGWRCVRGSLTFENAPVEMNDSALITTLRNAGVVMHIQTNVPEFYCHLVTWNKVHGVCRNPWNTAYTPGGSSGGASASLALGFTTLAMGSDMGGSIRFPAAMTGLYGFKPPYGRVATSLIQYESEGPLARTFGDLAIFQNVLAGPNEKMISSLKPKLEYPLIYGNINGWKIAYDPMDHWGFPVDETVRTSMKEVVQNLRALGAEVVEMDLGFRAEDFDIYALGLFSTSMGPLIFNSAKNNPDLITSYIADLEKKYSGRIAPEHLLNAEKWIFSHSHEIQQKVFTQGYKAIIMPTMCTPYVAADLGMNSENNTVTVDGNPYTASTWKYSFTWPWNMLGHHPVINVPIGSTKENIPLGMQIIGNTYDDLTVFQVAFQWSKVAPNFFRDNNYPGF